MKKMLVVGMVFGALALTSCKKDYTCTYGENDIDPYTYTDLNKTQKTAAKSACELAGGTFAKK